MAPTPSACSQHTKTKRRRVCQVNCCFSASQSGLPALSLPSLTLTLPPVLSPVLSPSSPSPSLFLITICLVSLFLPFFSACTQKLWAVFRLTGLRLWVDGLAALRSNQSQKISDGISSHARLCNHHGRATDGHTMESFALGIWQVISTVQCDHSIRSP